MTLWKAIELRFAKAMGGQRAGATGFGSPDILHPLFAPEVKHRKTLPVLVKDAMAQAVRNAPAGKLPMVILHEHGQRMNDALVVVRFGDWAEWFGAVDGAGDEHGM